VKALSLKTLVWLPLVLLSGYAASALAQDEQRPLDPAQKMGDYRRALFDQARKQARDEAQDLRATADEETPERVAALPTSTGQGAGFADRVNGSIADFLPLFQFAIDSVSTSDDKKSVTVKFNPIRSGIYGSLQVKATATEPEPYDALLNEIAEEQRAGQADAIRSQVDDLSDLTITAVYGYERDPPPAASLEDLGRLWGRNYGRYERVVGAFLLGWTEAVVNDLDAQEDAADDRLSDFDVRLSEGAATLGLNPDMDLDDLTIGQAQQILASEFDSFMALVEPDVRRMAEDAKKLEGLGLLPFLVDNQPQFTVTASYRDRDDLIGRDVWTGTLALEVGRYNFNTLLRRFREKQGARELNPAAATFGEMVANEERIRSGEKFTLSATYVRHDDYSRDYTFGELEENTVSLNLDESEEFCGKLEWIRNATWQPIRIDGEEVYPRVVLSVERVWASGDEMRQDRWVGNVTYNIPLQGGISVPLSLVYANHAEFLGEPDEQFSAHFGFNFKFKAAEAAAK